MDGPRPRKRTPPADWALAHPLRPPALRTAHLASAVFARPFSHRSVLAAHHSCVNALALAQGDDPSWLATGGDDQRVLLWDATLERPDAPPQPRAAYSGATSNIFTIAFSADNSRLYSAGNDAAILAHDLETGTVTSAYPSSFGHGSPPIDAWLDHQDAVNSLSAHPHHPALFLSASTDGVLHAFDTRTSPGRVGTVVDTCGMNDIVHHPLTPELFVYAAEDGHLGLIDGRMGWGTGGTTTSPGERGEMVQIAREVAVVRYDTRLSRTVTRDARLQSQTGRPHVSSVALCSSGTLLCATLSGYLPTLYELGSPTPLACFSSPAPSPYRGYRNTTTTKHGSFGGGRGAAPGAGLYYAAGSDDFNAYVWEVPSLARLHEHRRTAADRTLFGADTIVFHHKSSRSIGSDADKVIRSAAGHQTPAPAPAQAVSPDPSSSASSASASSASWTLPTPVVPAHAVLSAHRSIVNTALFHPSLPILYTSGVEKIVVRHRPGDENDEPEGNGDLAGRSSRRRGAAAWRFVPRVPAVVQASARAAGGTRRIVYSPSPPPRLLSIPPSGTNAAATSPLPATADSGVSAHEAQLRAEDLAVLEYFDALLVQAESGEDQGGFWKRERARGEGEESGGSSSDCDSEEEDDEDEEEEEERWAAEEGWGVLARAGGGDDGGEEYEGDGYEEERERLGARGSQGTTRRMLRAIYALEEAGESSASSASFTSSTDVDDHGDEATCVVDRRSTG